MLNILIDTNVAVDFVINRQPFYEMSAKIVEVAKLNYVKGFVSASSVTDIYYISGRELKNRKLAFELLKNFLKTFKVAKVSQKEIDNALELNWKDFEDAVQYSTALLSNMDYIITRNINDFESSEVPVITPEDFCKLLETEEPDDNDDC